MKKFLLVAVSLMTMFFSFAKVAHASQSGTLDFDSTISTAHNSAETVATGYSQNAPQDPPAAQIENPELSFSPPEQAEKKGIEKETTEKEPVAEPTPPLQPSTTATGFAPPGKEPVVEPTSPQPNVSAALADNTDAIFEGGSNSIVAKTVGHAEGTRSRNGSKTRAYYGHVDPGNGAWNLGSFSYQHCDASCTPAEADDRQLRRLRSQSEVIKQKAANNGVRMTLEEKLNGIDLANQAPLAALDQGGYVDWLKVAHTKGLTGSKAVLWARTYSFLNPRTQTWDAPGLGNRYDSISHDQERRRAAIARALENHYGQQSQVAASDGMPPSTIAQLR